MRRLFDLETARGLLAFGAALGLLLFPLLWAAHVGVARVRERSHDVPAPRQAQPASPSRAPSPAPSTEKVHGPELLMPVRGVAPASVPASFGEKRGNRRHLGLDIRAPRGTPIVAAIDGTLTSLLTSSRGGTEIYQHDSSGRYCLYYAHLQRYARGVREGMALKRGDLIAYVGSTGNAPENAPHLHFGLFDIEGRPQATRRCDGQALDPLPLLR
jgi:murein DD-endopeptidase MepM/ murein hydrolase activator NlpD